MASKKRTPFGTRLVQARRAKDLTQVQLAQRSGMSQAAISQAEMSGESSTFIATLAKVLGVNAEWLALGTGPRDAAQAQLYKEQEYQLLKSATKLSALAMELANLFDLIADPVRRARAYAVATQAIVDQLEAPAALEPHRTVAPDAPPMRERAPHTASSAQAVFE